MRSQIDRGSTISVNYRRLLRLGGKCITIWPNREVKLGVYAPTKRIRFTFEQFRCDTGDVSPRCRFVFDLVLSSGYELCIGA